MKPAAVFNTTDPLSPGVNGVPDGVFENCAERGVMLYAAKVTTAEAVTPCSMFRCDNALGEIVGAARMVTGYK